MYSLPLFPLDTVLFPGTPIHLFIFEERYKIMIRHILESDPLFGVVLIHTGVEAYGPVAKPHAVGCTAKIINMDPLPDGRMNLVCVGQEQFRIHELSDQLPYLVGTVETFVTQKPRTLEIVRGAGLLQKLVNDYLGQVASAGDRSNSEDDDFHAYLNQIQLPDDPTMLVYMACALLQIPTIEKQALLEIASVPNLYDTVLRLYKRELVVNANLAQISDGISHKSAWLN